MDKWFKRTIELLTSISFGKDGDMSVIPYYPQKTEISTDEEKYFKRSIPEAQGISSKRLYNMLCELEAEERANIHNLLVLRGGEVICECSREGYGTGIWHLSHSMSKTVTGMAIGMLYDDGMISLDDKLYTFFPEIAYKDKRFTQITVEHLLSMQSGIPFAEAGSITETGWTEAFFASGLKYTPGTSFSYNSMNSYLLARIVCKLSGKSLCEFLDERLFAPLGIKNYFWEMGHEGVEKGGWGLFLSPESWAKIGLMLLRGGVFEGKRILSEKWCKASTQKHADAPMINGDFNYAYQLWVGRNTDEVLFNGMLGQNVWLCPKNDIVVVINSGNNELFQLSPAMDIIRKYLGCDIEDVLTKRDIRALHEREAHFFDTRRWVRPLEKKRGLLYFLHLRTGSGFDERWSKLLGKYLTTKNNVSILPLFTVSMQNNFKAGIESIELRREGEGLFLDFCEGAVDYSVEIGLYEYKRAILEFRGEKYLCEILGEAITNAKGDEEYRIEFVFPELPNTRMLRIVRGEGGRLDLEFTEIPNNKIVENLLARVPHTSGIAGFVIDFLEKRFGEDFIEKKVEDVFTPRIVAMPKNAENCERVLDEENAKAAEESGAVRFLRAVVDKFFKESIGGPRQSADVDAEAVLDAEKRGLFAKLFGGKK